MARPRSLKPSYRFDRSSGRAFVELDGRRVYLGRHGTQESHDRYDQVIGEWIANGRRLPPRTAADGETTVAIVVAAFWRHAQGYYREPDGAPSRELGINVRYTVTVVPRVQFSPNPAASAPAAGPGRDLFSDAGRIADQVL